MAVGDIWQTVVRYQNQEEILSVTQHFRESTVSADVFAAEELAAGVLDNWHTNRALVWDDTVALIDCRAKRVFGEKSNPGLAIHNARPSNVGINLTEPDHIQAYVRFYGTAEAQRRARGGFYLCGMGTDRQVDGRWDAAYQGNLQEFGDKITDSIFGQTFGGTWTAVIFNIRPVPLVPTIAPIDQVRASPLVGNRIDRLGDRPQRRGKRTQPAQQVTSSSSATLGEDQ